MTNACPAPSLPQPEAPVAAASAIARTAQAAACAWARPLDQGAHNRAVSQLHSVVRDLGIAARGLAAFETEGGQRSHASSNFRQDVDSGSRWLLDAWQRLSGVLAAEGISPSHDPDEPGAALCRAARNAILAWRQPAGAAADRDESVRHLITATGFISAAITRLATSATRRLVIELQAARASLAEAAACLTAAILPPADGNLPELPDGEQ